MSAVATGLRMALPQNEMDVEVGAAAPELAKAAQAHAQLVQHYPPPPHRLTALALHANFWVEEQRSQGSASRSSAARGGGDVVLPCTSGLPVPHNLHECDLYICMYVYMYIQAPPNPPPPLAMPAWVV